MTTIRLGTTDLQTVDTNLVVAQMKRQEADLKTMTNRAVLIVAEYLYHCGYFLFIYVWF